ncbi:DNA topoisomerase-3 [Paraburkholderia phenazinium]|uniref:DNA topoisomerase n=1 Tax=Paraburkholderia phenazinium TaxID=60549 RepID=A0A1G7YHG2_9BURK|nr:DNA topoisomerase 3 [Paraburkholderia phenazinium]SDG95978.1 DNA topoisomerase-3 [Paraburkholderia phenazinium]
MRLWIFEKPSMAQAVLPHLPKPHKRQNGYVETGDGYVSWLAGHVLEQVQPGDYDERWGKFPWAFEDLPIIPKDWKLKITEDKKDQVAVIKALLKKCTSVVNGGDADREGQLLVDEVLLHFGNTKPVARIHMSAMDPVTVKKAIANLEDNTQYFPLYEAGLGRQRADWLVGMNMSRAYTILAKKQNYPGVLSVGRVQSPTLAIVVKRDREIDAFVPKDFWTIEAQFADPAQPALPFWSRWLPPGLSLESAEKQAELDANGEAEEDEECADADELQGAAGTAGGTRPAWLDAQNRIIDKAKADQLAAKVQQAGQGVVTRYLNKPVEERAPMPFELTGLQTALNARYGYSAKQVLDTFQELYLAGHVTYPRSDCAYLPESQHGEAPVVLDAIAQGAPHLATLVANANVTIRSRAWNDKQVGEHHALIPTVQAPDWNSLTAVQKHTYEMVARQYVAQFYPNCLVDKSKIEITIADERFAANGRVVKDPGWRAVFQGEAPAADAGKAPKGSTPLLPVLAEQSWVDCKAVNVAAKRTTPPPRYTEGSLLTAMKHVYRTVSDPEERKKLKALDGIGRSATRAAIIETILKRSFVEAKGKQLVSTVIGRILVDALPKKLIDPGMTARWEALLDGIATKRVPLDAFMKAQEETIVELVRAAQASTLPTIPPEAMPARKPYTGANGKPTPRPVPAGAEKCPKCKKGHLVPRTVKNGPKAGQTFKGCTNYPECKHSVWPK